jgi:hypothetical protein
MRIKVSRLGRFIDCYQNDRTPFAAVSYVRGLFEGGVPLGAGPSFGGGVSSGDVFGGEAVFDAGALGGGRLLGGALFVIVVTRPVFSPRNHM